MKEEDRGAPDLATSPEIYRLEPRHSQSTSLLYRERPAETSCNFVAIALFNRFLGPYPLEFAVPSVLQSCE